MTTSPLGSGTLRRPRRRGPGRPRFASGATARTAARTASSARVTSTLPAPPSSSALTISATCSGVFPSPSTASGRSLAELPVHVDAREAEVAVRKLGSRSSAAAGSTSPAAPLRAASRAHRAVPSCATIIDRGGLVRRERRLGSLVLVVAHVTKEGKGRDRGGDHDDSSHHVRPADAGGDRVLNGGHDLRCRGVPDCPARCLLLIGRLGENRLDLLDLSRRGAELPQVRSRATSSERSGSPRGSGPRRGRLSGWRRGGSGSGGRY